MKTEQMARLVLKLPTKNFSYSPPCIAMRITTGRNVASSEAFLQVTRFLCLAHSTIFTVILGCLGTVVT